MKHNPDDRKDNVERIQQNINHTIQNMEVAEEMIEKTSCSKTKQDLKEKNDRRREVLNHMRAEIQDEAWDKEHGYQ